MGKALHAAGSQGTDDGATVFERIASDLYRQGYSLIDDAIPDELSLALLERVTALKQSEFSRAGIGRAQDQMLNNFVRRRNPLDREPRSG